MTTIYLIGGLLCTAVLAAMAIIVWNAVKNHDDPDTQGPSAIE